MAGCGCQSQQCNCVIVAGSGTTLTGSGSVGSPYVISADVEALEVADTDTVDLTLATGDPQQLTADVKVDPAANLLTASSAGLAVTCEDVQDCVGEAVAAGQGLEYDDAGNALSASVSGDAGNAVTYGSDGGLYAAGAAAAIVTGCGVTGNGTSAAPLTAAVPAWPWPCAADTAGEPVACGADGLLHAPPVQTVWVESFSGGALTYTPPAGTSADGFAQPFELTLTNPDACREMLGTAWVSVTHRVSMGPGAEIAVSISGDAHHRWSNGTDSTRQWFHRAMEGVSLAIAPGGTQTISWTVQSNVPTGSATVIQTICQVGVQGVSM